MDIKEIINCIKEKNLNHITKCADFDQFEFSPLKNGAIIFTNSCMKKLMKQMMDTRELGIEYGCFLYGKELTKHIYLITKYGKDFISSIRSLDTTDENIKELNQNINLYAQGNRKYDCVIHYHTHPNYENLGYSPEKYSNSDLYSYGILQSDYQQNKNSKTIYFGCLMSDSNRGLQMSCITYNDIKEKFYIVPELYYFNKNEELREVNMKDLEYTDTSTNKILKLQKKILDNLKS